MPTVTTLKTKLKKSIANVSDRLATNITQDGKPIKLRQVRPAGAIHCLRRAVDGLRGKEEHPV